MNRIAYRSTSFMLAAVMTLGTLKGIAALAAVTVAQEPIALPVVEVFAAATPVVQIAANTR